MSVGMCVGVAEAMGMRYAGLEYRRECWVGERLVEEGRNGVAVAEGECGFSCWGERGEICGGRDRVSLWKRGG